MIAYLNEDGKIPSDIEKNAINDSRAKFVEAEFQKESRN